MFTSSYSLLPSCSLALFFLLLFYFSLKARGSANETARNAKPFRTKQGWIAKNWSKIAMLQPRRQPFRTKWGSIAKNWSKIAMLQPRQQPFRTKRASIAKNWSKIAITTSAATLSHETSFDRQKLQWNCDFTRRQPFRTKRASIV